jgi:aminoacrylate peracid reductase
MPHQVITPNGAAPPMAPYSPAIKAGNVLYISGTLAMDSQGKVVGAGDIRTQTKCVLDSIRQIVKAAGGDLSNIAYNTIFLSDFADYKAMNEVYAEYFPVNPPARYCIKAELVKPEYLVEISSIAHL